MMLKTRQIIDSVKSLNHILALELPAKTGFELSRLVNNLQPVFIFDYFIMQLFLT